MTDTVYLHRVEYFRRQDNGSLVREHVETADDHGWYIERGAAWRDRYTRACAEDFLARTGASRGVYSVAVWRGTTRVCTVGLHWPGSPTDRVK
ncbi:hypothetical protein ACIQMJ_04945 [Actinosynnema sp. NPDC091369]